ncbi:MAG: DEAD/DEAH box helicase [Cyanophyceae cyanobacterium]
MSTLHGSWFHSDSYFLVWGETWRSMTAVDSAERHPFCLSQQELLAFWSDYNLKPDSEEVPLKDKWQSAVITVPSAQSEHNQTLLPILSRSSQSSATLQSWQVEGLRLTPLETIRFLSALPLGIQASGYVGADLRFWSYIYRWSLDLLARGKFLPGIHQNGSIQSRWQPLIDSITDQARLAKFIQQMPRACCAYQQSETPSLGNLAAPQKQLLDFLNHILDAQLRDWLESSPPPPRATAVEQWVHSLTSASAAVSLETKEAKRLETAMQNWTLPVQDYLISADNRQGQNLFRVCLTLVPPTPGETNWGYTDWKLKYALQALDDSELLVDATTIWQHPVSEFVFAGRTIQQPQETLLKGLGLASRLYAPIAESLQEPLPSQCQINPIQVYEFIRSSAWQLQDNGLGVILPPGLASGAGEKRLGVKITAQVNPKERLGLKNLLQYSLELAVGEQTISQPEFERLLEQKSPLVEINGEWIALQPADVRAAQEVLAQSNQMSLSVEDALRLSTGDTKVIAKLPVASFEASGVLQELIDNLTNNQAIAPLEPPGFRGELRPYQARGVGWLAFLERWGLGACLADDMGLGKTPQLIAFLLHLKAEAEAALNRPTLVVCPTSVLNNWEREVQKFAPTLKTRLHHGDKRSKGKTFAREVKDRDVVITSYAIAYRDEKTLSGVDWRGIVLDEAQNIKNPQAKQSQAVRQLGAEFRIALTGTPVENRLSELWSILDFLNPGYLGTQQFFQRRFAIPIEKYGDRDSLATLRSLARPFILRRLKTDKDIIQDLPEKQEMRVFCGLSTEQAQLYQTLVDKSLAEIEATDGIQRRGLILTLLMKLKQVCNHPAQFLKQKQITSSDRSGKLLRLEEMLAEIIEEGDASVTADASRALIFTQFSEWGKLLQPYLEKQLGREVLFLYGATRRQQRQEMIDRFQHDPNGPRVFILSLKAGGTGLNLTRANHVFHIDRWWNPAVEDQATDRAFRIGQKRNVQVHKFICTGTLEERIDNTIESKKQLAELTVDTGEQWLTELDTNQLRELLLLERDAIMDEESS